MSEPYYPSFHEKEVYNVPEVFFNNGATLGTYNAAKYLGITYSALLRHADSFGLTVLRRQAGSRSWRYFLVSELSRLKNIMGTLSREDVIKAGGIDGEVSVLQDVKAKKG